MLYFKKNMKGKLYFNIFLFLFYLLSNLFFSQEGYSDSESKVLFDSGIKYENKDFQNDLLDEIKKNRIPFKLDEEGVIHYPAKYQKRIDEIIKKLDNRPSIALMDPNDRKKIMTILERKNISYKLRNLDTKENIYILWEQEDNDIVRKIIRENIYSGQPLIPLMKKGVTRYPGNYQEKIDEMLKQLDNRPFIAFDDLEYAQKLSSLLKENSINNDIKHLDPRDYIYVFWGPKDNNVAREIIRDIFYKWVQDKELTRE